MEIVIQSKPNAIGTRVILYYNKDDRYPYLTQIKYEDGRFYGGYHEFLSDALQLFGTFINTIQVAALDSTNTPKLLEDLKKFVNYIANDSVELSHDKIKLQRDDYIKMARELQQQMHKE